MESQEGYKPPVTFKGRVLRALAAVGIIFSASTAAEAVSGGAVSKIPGNVAQAGRDLVKEGANTVIEWDNRGMQAGSAGIPAQKLSGGKSERDQRDEAQAVQAAKDQAESDAIRQKLGTQKNLP